MEKAISDLKMLSIVVVSIHCLLIAACDQRDSTDLVEKGGYPRTYPALSPKETSTTVEKPNVEEEFFEADKLI